MQETSHPTSPHWSSTIKLIVGLTIAGMILVLVIYFRSIIGPLLLAVIVSYLLHPLAAYLGNITRISWRGSVNIIYLLLIILLLGSSTLTGLALVQQVQALIVVIERFVSDLPSLLDELSMQSYMIGPFRLDLSQFSDLGALGEQIISALQLVLGRAGSLVGSLATGAANTIGWGFFVLVVSYFLLADAGKVPDAITYIDIPGYAEDIRRISREMSRIWNAFLRGQLTIVIMVVISYTILLSILGVRFSFALAILAGLARFVPWIGPFVSVGVTALVTFFQGSNYFKLEPFYYMLLVLGLSMLLDQIYDNLVQPRVMGQSLGVHPAAVLVVAILAANIIGIVGLLLAAPVLASIKLIGRYTLRKMLDLDPWPDAEKMAEAENFNWMRRLFIRVRAWWRKVRKHT
ncbi:MAG: AI-2E family transporter [Anaerolineales bacterium]|nr:AI-2E family transporter [Anaerolineales bacterium]